MKILLFDPTTDGAVRSACNQQDVRVQAMTVDASRQGNSLPGSLDGFDAMIVEMTEPNDRTQVLLAQAILASVPTLCLYKKNFPPRTILTYIRARKTPRPIKTYSYTPDSLVTAVDQFVRLHDPDSEVNDSSPSIKYTLRLTPSIDRYLEWASEQQSRTKATIIRHLLQSVADDDEDFRDMESRRK